MSEQGHNNRGRQDHSKGKHKHHGKGKFDKGKKGNKDSGAGKGNFDDLMKGFVMFTDRNREKNCVTDANNFLIPIIQELFPNVYQCPDNGDKFLNKKLKLNQQTITFITKEENETPQKQVDSPIQNQNNSLEVKTENNVNENEANVEAQIELNTGTIQHHKERNLNFSPNKNEQVQDQQDNEEPQEDISNSDNQEEDEEIQGDAESNGQDQRGEEGEDEAQQEEQVEEEHQQPKAGNTVDRLEAELADLKSQKDKLLYNVNTDVKCTVFLKIHSKFANNIDVTAVVESVMNKVHIEKTPLTRFCHRMFPAEYAFKASEENFQKYAKILIEEKFPTDQPCSWMLESKSRNNNKFNRKNILDVINQFIPKIHFVDYKDPYYTVVVDICHNLMCLSVLKNFYGNKKYSVKVNPKLNNVLDTSFIPAQAKPHLNKQTIENKQPFVTEEDKQLHEEKQEQIKAQLRAEKFEEDENDIDLI